MRARLFSLLLLLVLLTGCASSPATAPSAAPQTGTPIATAQSAPAFPVTVTDDVGRTVTFDKAPQRIISLTPGHTETLYALGVGDRVIETDKYSDYPAENKPKAKLVTYPKPNIEEIVTQNPDLVVVLVEGDEFLQQLDSRGIKALKLFPKTFAATLGTIELLGKVSGTSDAAHKITADMRRREEAVTAKTRTLAQPRVLYELDASDPTKPFVAGPGGFFGNLVPLAGGKNVFDDLGSKTFARISAEDVVTRDPEVIILGDADQPLNPQTPDMVKQRHSWDQIAAVRAGHVYPMDNAFLSRPGPRLVDGLEQMAKLIHPEVFK
jgi:iron complex transport system substrate-binding protein